MLKKSFILCLICLVFFSCPKKREKAESIIIEPEAVDLSSLKFYNEFTGFRYKSTDISDIRKKIEKVEEELIKKIEKIPANYKIVVVGHADKSGPEQPMGKKKGNIYWSEGRAESLVKYLSEKYNIPEERFEIVAKGSSELKLKKNPFSKENRRVEIKFEP